MHNIAKLEILNLEIDAIIGVYDYERSMKQPIILDLIIFYDCQNAIQNDVEVGSSIVLSIDSILNPLSMKK